MRRSGGRAVTCADHRLGVQRHRRSGARARASRTRPHALANRNRPLRARRARAALAGCGPARGPPQCPKQRPALRPHHLRRNAVPRPLASRQASRARRRKELALVRTTPARRGNPPAVRRLGKRCWIDSGGVWAVLSARSASSITKWSGPGSLRPTRAPRTSASGSSLLPTPTVKGNHNRAGLSARSGDGLSTAINRGLSHPGPLNPPFLEWLMGFPIGHSETELSATPAPRRKRASSAG